MSNTTAAEVIKAATAPGHARLAANIESETNPEYKANMTASLESQKAWLAAHSQDKYVGTGSTFETGFRVEFRKLFVTESEAVAELARFPKFIKAKSYCQHLGNDTRVYVVALSVALCSGNTTGTANETGMKRLARFLATAGEFVWHNEYCKNHLTREAFNSATGF